jgi:NAD(P)H-quinone oxidoreductase subunit 5
MMQCGLGLFPAAIAHLCWHGLFKAFLFLNAGSVVKTKRMKNTGGVDMLAFLLASFVGFLGAYCFAIVSEKSIFTRQTTTFLVGFAFISGTQCAYTLLEHQKTVWRLLCVCLGVILAGVFYGESIYWVESLLPMGLTSDAIELSNLNMLVFGLFLVLWLFMNLHALGSWSSTKAWSAVYMNALNASQPHSSTVTASRKTYQF